ncbi:MAG: ABC transporter substrate-binding protein [Candidatus Omnitrophota bacterium]
MKKRAIFLLALAALLCGFIYADAAALKKVKIGYSRLRISLPVFVAQKEGIFEKNGLDVELEMFDTAQPLMDALCGGKLDVAGYCAFPITFSAQLRSGKTLRYATMLMEDSAHPISMFVVKKDSSISSIAGLKGKRVGILPTYAYKVWLELILEKNGIKPDEIVIQQVAPAMTASTLESGAVDAVFTNDPALTVCLQKGIGKLLYKDALVPRYFWSPFPFASFNIADEFAKSNPETVKRIVKSLDEAIDFINSNQREAKKIMADFLPDAQKDFVENYPDALFLRSDQVKEKELIKIEESYKELGIIKKPLDLSESLCR